MADASDHEEEEEEEEVTEQDHKRIIIWMKDVKHRA